MVYVVLRLRIAHPFNPPLPRPLVEVVGGDGHRRRGGVDLRVLPPRRQVGDHDGREVPGFIANRLQEALWREALHMVANGEATVEQIDASITEGPGLRWAFHGPMLTFHLAGGPGGMAHMLDHSGPSLLSPWTRLAAPDLTHELRERVVRGLRRRRPGRAASPIWCGERDRALVDILRVLGKAPGWLKLEWAEDVRPEWIDYNGHLSEALRAGVRPREGRGDGRARMTPEYLLETGTSLFTLEAHVRYLDQMPAGGAAVGAHVGDRGDGQADVALARDGSPRTGCGRPRRCSWSTWTRRPGGRARSPTTCGPAPRRCGCRAPEHASRRIGAVG